MHGIATMPRGSVSAGVLGRVFGIVFEFGNVFERSVFVLRARNVSPLRAGNAFEFGNVFVLGSGNVLELGNAFDFGNVLERPFALRSRAKRSVRLTRCALRCKVTL